MADRSDRAVVHRLGPGFPPAGLPLHPADAGAPEALVDIPGDWDELWERLPRFRRIWRVGSVLWGVALLVDAALRVLMAYTLPINSVPALGTTLYLTTTVVLIVVTNLYYGFSGLYHRQSSLYAPLREGTKESTPAR
jgi:hypothetical protein